MMIFRLLAGTLAKKTGEAKIILTGCVCLIGANLIIAHANTAMPIIAAGILTGIGIGITTPVLNSLVFKIAKPERKGVANSNYLLINDIGMGFGASFWGLTSQYAGYTVTYTLSAVCVFISGFTHAVFLVPKIKKLT